MKKIVILSTLLMTGCASTVHDNLYYETAKSINRDQTAVQLACWNAVTELNKGSDPASKMAAVALAKECKTPPTQLNRPTRRWF